MKDKLRQIVLDRLSNTLIMNGSLYPWNNSYTRILNLFIKEEILSLKDVAKALREALLQAGHNAFDQHIITGKYPDHTNSPEALAYVLDHDGFTPEEEKQIQFDHGETKEEFIQLYGKNILKNVIQFALTEREFSEKNNPKRPSCC